MFLLINKPSGPTSHDIIKFLRRITNIKKIGHTGTLDPFASGLLIIAIHRESTKKITDFAHFPKEYKALLQLGAVSDTYDRAGKIEILKTPPLTQKNISMVLPKFVGQQKQIPPMFSAKKINGKKLYKLARQGITVLRQPASIMIHSIEILNLDLKNLTLEIKVCCSTGTYIRSLAHDIGQALGCGAYLQTLQRTKIGPYTIENSFLPDQLNSLNWQNFIFEP
ncbi:MAG TPA: tRNA pseudouridine(55) synthase TruB [bacterium]|nr:tRNA pseudouridine(55) synthase TruB [bacterium]